MGGGVAWESPFLMVQSVSLDGPAGDLKDYNFSEHQFYLGYEPFGLLNDHFLICF